MAVPLEAIVEEPHLDALIPAFYARVRADPLIGPVFNDAIEDWDKHLVQLIAFWSSVMNTTGRYKGSPMAAHLKHRARITPEMFERWLTLWGQITEEMLPPDEARAMQAKANTIGESLKLALFFRLGKDSPPQPYKLTAVWDENTLPAGVRNRHNTKAGVWGLLTVLEGTADLVFEDSGRRVRVSPGHPGEIPPEEWHHVEITGRAKMQVGFYREKPLP